MASSCHLGSAIWGLLMGMGQVEAAISQALAAEDRYGERKDAQGGLDFARELEHAGYQMDGRRLFEANEPLGLLGGPSRRNDHLDGPWQLLYAWAKAALVFDGPERVFDGVEALNLPPDRADRQSPADRKRVARAYMLTSAAMEALDRDRGDDATRFLEALDTSEPIDADAWFRARIHGWSRLPRASAESLEAISEVLERVGSLLDEERTIELADALYRSGDRERAAGLLASVAPPPLPEEVRIGESMDIHHARYRLFPVAVGLWRATRPRGRRPRS